MQRSQQEYYRYLRIGKLAGSLTEQEDELFDKLLRQDEDFAKEFRLLQEKIPAQKLHALDRFKDNEQWGGLKSKLDSYQGPPAFTSKNISLGIVLLAALFFGGWFLLQREPGPVLAKAAPSVQLKLADGKTINLSNTGGVIKTEGALINNTNKNLTYSASGAAASEMNTLTVAPGLDYRITLDDGTQVWLNSTTRLDFPFVFPGNSREIRIDGEAYLEVAKNADKPFIVHLPNSTVRVTGTSFNVNTYNRDVNTVSLVEGAVIMKGAKGEVALVPGKEAVSSPDNIHLQDFNRNRTLSWQQGLLYFNKSPLTEIAKAIPRWFNVKVVIDNSRNANKLFVGVINKHRPLSVFLKDLETTAEIGSYFDREGVLHFR